jgi:hypothetical protein
VQEKINPQIDFVIPWVDGSDPEWLKLFNQYAPVKKSVALENYTAENRYSDTGLLRYWFRSIEKNAPWVHKVFFITNGQKPDWLNVNCEKLVWVKHEDYIPKEWLPTFSANPIELNLHRIKDLSEHFVYFNDDFYIIKKIKESYYFNKQGLPCDFAIQSIIPGTDFAHIKISNIVEINTRFSKTKVISKHKRKWFSLVYGKNLWRLLYFSPMKRFTGFLERHTSQAFLKSTFEDVWKNCENILLETCANKFRSVTDVNQYLLRYWQLVTGRFHPSTYKGRKKLFHNITVHDIEKCFQNPKIKEICINEEVTQGSVELFEKYFPEKSMFEL